MVWSSFLSASDCGILKKRASVLFISNKSNQVKKYTVAPKAFEERERNEFCKAE